MASKGNQRWNSSSAHTYTKRKGEEEGMKKVVKKLNKALSVLLVAAMV